MGRSDFLFPDASFAEGAGSAFDLLGILAQYNSAPSDREADRRALESDWAVAGDHLWWALVELAKELDERPPNAKSA